MVYRNVYSILQPQEGGNAMLNEKLITNDKIEKEKRIGNGQFGEVYKGNRFAKWQICC